LARTEAEGDTLRNCTALTTRPGRQNYGRSTDPSKKEAEENVANTEEKDTPMHTAAEDSVGSCSHIHQSTFDNSNLDLDLDTDTVEEVPPI
jgi:hypothetical protein